MARKYDVAAFAKLAKENESYWIEKAVLQFTEEVVSKMEQQNLSRTELAARIGVSPPHITQILRGSTNFTLQSMVKVSRALGCELQTHLQPQGMRSHWFDLLLGEDRSAGTECRTCHDWFERKSHYTNVAQRAEEEADDDTLAIAS